MTTAEKNAAIARFLGSDYINKPWKDRNGILHDYWHWSKPDCGYPSSIGIGELSTAWEIGNFHFHSDWNWLMLCVSKIELMGHTGFMGTFQMFGLGRTKVYCYQNEILCKEIDITGERYGINPTHEAVYQFVVWHNQEVNQTPKP